jgi:hypothetical protein
VSDIFISYAREDHARVQLLADALSGYGWSVWWDQRIPAGKTFDQFIADALADAQCVVVVWSRHSVASSWVREEADEGRKRGVLIPVLIDKVSPPLGFGRIHAASLTEWDGDQDSEAFQRLAADIAGLIDPPPGRTPPPRPIVPITPELPAGTSPPVIPGPESRPARRFSFQRRTSKLFAALALVVVLVLGFVAYRTGRPGGNDREPAPLPPDGKTGLRVSAVLADGGEPLDGGVAYQVFAAEENAEGHRKYITGSSHPHPAAWFPLPAGRYVVNAAYRNAFASAHVEVTPGIATRQILNLSAGYLRVTAVLAEGTEALSGVAYNVYAAAPDAEGHRKRITSTNSQRDASAWFLLPAARYFVTAAYGGASASVVVEVTPAASTQQAFNLQAGILRLTAVLAGGGQPLTGAVAYDVYTAARNAEGNRKRITGSNHSPGPSQFVIPIGRYYVTAAHSAGNASAETAVTAGRTRDVQLRLVPVTKR